MPRSDNLKRHAALLDRMATTLGIDLQEAAIHGDLRIDEIADAVLRCTDCADPLHCDKWLADHPEGAEGTPDYCRNSELLQGLRPNGPE